MASKAGVFAVKHLSQLIPTVPRVHVDGIRLKADEVIFQGCMAALDPANSGQLLAADPSMPAGCRVIGVNVEDTVDNRNGLIGAKRLKPAAGIYAFNVSGSFNESHVGRLCRVVDDHTIGIPAGTDADRFAGVFLGLDEEDATKGWVLIGFATSQIAPGTLATVTAANGSDAGSTQTLANELKARFNALHAILLTHGLVAPAP